jgi:hypothetical protein
MRLEELAGLRTKSEAVFSLTLLLLAPSLALTQAPKGNQNAQSGGMQTPQGTQTASNKQEVNIGNISLPGKHPVITQLDTQGGNVRDSDPTGSIPERRSLSRLRRRT